MLPSTDQREPVQQGPTTPTEMSAWARRLLYLRMLLIMVLLKGARHHCRWAVAQVRHARAATPWRTVRFTRSRKAVFKRQRHNHGPATLRAASVPRRITCEILTS